MSLLSNTLVRVSAVGIACLVLGTSATNVRAQDNLKAKKYNDKTIAGS